MNGRPHLVIVGGFLGAGKTTLILAAARILAARGLKSAVILNDQGDDLVDSRLARAAGFAADQVAGGCFCCRFSDLLSAAGRLRGFAPDVIFAEPVGSCTDIAATILHPLRTEFSSGFRLAPYTVLVDPYPPAAHGGLRFIWEKQIEEAEIVLRSKADLDASATICAKTGEGVEAWLDFVLSGQSSPPEKYLDIDYTRYAQAEAALAWLNATAAIRADPPLSPAQVLGPLFDAIHQRLNAASIPIAHLKMVNDSPAGFLKAAITGNAGDPAVEGALAASPCAEHEIVINLRAVADPAAVAAIVKEQLAGAAISRFACFSPSPPKPERRYLPNR